MIGGTDPDVAALSTSSDVNNAKRGPEEDADDSEQKREPQTSEELGDDLDEQNFTDEVKNADEQKSVGFAAEEEPEKKADEPKSVGFAEEEPEKKDEEGEKRLQEPKAVGFALSEDEPKDKKRVDMFANLLNTDYAMDSIGDATSDLETDGEDFSSPRRGDEMNKDDTGVRFGDNGVPEVTLTINSASNNQLDMVKTQPSLQMTDNKMDRMDTQRAMEATVLHKRLELFKNLRDDNELMYIALSEVQSYNYEEEELTQARMAYNQGQIKLERMERVWEFNLDAFEQLREQVARRESLIKEMQSITFEYELYATFYGGGGAMAGLSVEDDILPENLEDENLKPTLKRLKTANVDNRLKTTDEIADKYRRKLEELQALNTRITTLEIQVETEQNAQEELYKWFDGRIQFGAKNDEEDVCNCDCYGKAIKDVALYAEGDLKRGPRGSWLVEVPIELGENGKPSEKSINMDVEKEMTVDEFKDFWMKHFGVILDKRKFKFFINQRNENTMRTYAQSCKMVWLDPDNKMKQHFDFENHEAFWNYPDIEKIFKNVFRPKFHSLDNIDRSVFKGFLRYVYGVQPEEARYLIQDNIMMTTAQKKEESQFMMHALFVVICALLLGTVLYTYGGQDRFLQNAGTKQILFGTMWDDKKFENINSAGTVFQYMNDVLLQYAYGGLEWCHVEACDPYKPKLDDNTIRKFESNGEYEYAAAMNPYVIGGFRMRTIRSRRVSCDDKSMRFGGSEAVQNTEPFTGKCGAIDSKDMEEGVWERFTAGGSGIAFDRGNRSTWFDPDIADTDSLQKLNEIYIHRKREDINEARIDRGSLESGYTGDGYIVDFPPYSLQRNGLQSCKEFHDGVEDGLRWCALAGCGDLEPLSICEARYMLKKLQENDFIDGLTRIVLVDLYLFNPTMLFHSFVRLSFETRLGAVFPDNEVETYNLMVYAQSDNTGPVICLTFFMICSLIFTGYHLNQCLSALNLLGYPICCLCCFHRRRSNRMAKMSDSTRRWVVENHQMVQFLTYIPKNERLIDDAKTGLLLIPIENVTHHRVKQKEYSLIKCLNQVIRTGGHQAQEIEIKDVILNDHGGCTVVFAIDADEMFDLDKEPKGRTCLAKPSEKEEMYMQIGDDFEELLQVYFGEEIKILVDSKPSNLEIIIGHGILTFYSNFWNSLDSLVVFLIWLWFLIHISVYPSINADDYIDPLTFKSMRFMRLRILWESCVLFALSWCAVMKMAQWLVSLNDTVKQFYNMIRDSIGIIASYCLLLVLWCTAFGIIGYCQFSSKLYEFRYWWEVILTMVRHVVTPMDADYLGSATVGFGGYLYYIAQTLVVSLILINIFLAIILKAWDDVSDEMSNKKRNTHWFPQFNRFLGIGVKQELKDPKEDWLEVEEEWRRVYPAGCPNRRLKHYLVNQLEVDDEDADLLMEFVDTDKSGTVSWSELEILLKHFKPNVDNKNFAIRRRHTHEMTTYATSLGQKFTDFRDKHQQKRENMDQQLSDIYRQLEEISKRKKGA